MIFKQWPKSVIPLGLRFWPIPPYLHIRNTVAQRQPHSKWLKDQGIVSTGSSSKRASSSLSSSTALAGKAKEMFTAKLRAVGRAKVEAAISSASALPCQCHPHLFEAHNRKNQLATRPAPLQVRRNMKKPTLDIIRPYNTIICTIYNYWFCFPLCYFYRVNCLESCAFQGFESVGHFWLAESRRKRWRELRGSQPCSLHLGKRVAENGGIPVLGPAHSKKTDDSTSVFQPGPFWSEEFRRYRDYLVGGFNHLAKY